jgi:hypothetical protein
MQMKNSLLAFLFLLLSYSVCHAQKIVMKPLSELIDDQDPGWSLISQWSSSATNKIEILPKDDSRADSALYQLQISTSSPVAAMVYGCGGILVDHGWIRILGSGSKQFERSLPRWNKGRSISNYGDASPFILVADDVLGGFFAINAGGIDDYDIGKVFYYGPNKLKWETTGLGYNDFIVFCFSGDLKKFYDGFRWKGWEDEISKLTPGQVISCYPMLWTDAGVDLTRNRKVIPVEKQYSMYHIQNKTLAKKTTKKYIAKRNK